ncbi:MAG: serine hydrolase domain-containing protein [Ilumatobacteraceae bacterium]
MRALELISTWPVPTVGAAVVVADGTVAGDAGAVEHRFRLASLSKPLVAWSALVAVEEGIVTLDDHVGRPGCTLRHLLAHAGGYPFEGREPITGVATRRIYSNAGIELAAGHIERAADMPIATYLAEAVFDPLGMEGAALEGSPAHAVWATVADVVAFLAEVQAPTLIDPTTAAAAFQPQYPDLAGIVPGVGQFDPCPWGLGFEIRGGKSPHWTGRHNSASTFGHFGGAGTMMWVDPDAGCGLVALTDRLFDQWAGEALVRWPELSDAVLGELGDPEVPDAR